MRPFRSSVNSYIPMKERFLKSIILLLVLLTPMVASAGWINSPAPDFTLQDSNGQKVSLSQFKGRVVLINFWASWCAPCKKEFPNLNSFVGKYDSSDVVVLAININKKRSHADDFLNDAGALNKNMFVLFDPSAKVIPLYKARAMPTSFIIDKEGLIRHVHFGYNKKDPKKWIAEVDALLGKTPGSTDKNEEAQ